MSVTVMLPETKDDIESMLASSSCSPAQFPCDELCGMTDSWAEDVDDLHVGTVAQQVDEACWEELYPPLQTLARYLVNTLPLPYWHGRENDVAEDIAQETMRRLLERFRKAERGEAPPIKSMRQMATTIAYNYYRDLKRHEHRLLRLDQYSHGHYIIGDTSMHLPNKLSEQIDFESIIERVDQEALFYLAAREIERFPKKQRHALLIDLANRMSFDEQPTPLQAAFLAVGIDLRLYRQLLPTDQRERSRHISLLSQAKKRLMRLATELRDRE